MTILTVNPQGQIIVGEDVVKQLGVKPGDRVELSVLPGGKAEIAAAPKTLTFRDLQGFLKGKTNGKRLTIDEINTAIEEAGARAGMGE
ncbi:MAG TPA: transcriptional regulator [Ensifer sp.]|nr:transcriptional regulator [Ensifer sp.]